MNDILTGDNLPGYFSNANAINPYIVVENVVENRNDVYDIYGVPINSEIYAPTFRGSGASWDAATCHNVIATSDAPPVEIVAGGIAKLCNMRWRRVDSAPDVIFGNPLTVPVSSLPPQSATATRKQGNQCVWQHTHDSIDDFPNNYELCETLFSAGGTYSGWNNFNLDGYVGPLTQLGVAYGSGLGNGFRAGFSTILGTMIFSPFGIQAGGDYSQQGATANWPTSTLPTPTTICGTNPPVSAVGRSDGQNVIVSCPTQWRTIPDGMVTSIDNDKLDPNLPGQTAAGDYCIISQSAPATAETTARRCDTIFGDVGGGIQRLVDAAIRSHGYVNAHLNTNTPANPIPTTPAATDVWWLNSTATFSPYGVKLQGAQNVDYVLSAVQDDFDAEDCVRAKWKTSISPPALFGARLSTIQGLQQGCTAQIAIAPTPPPLGTTPNPPSSSLQRTCELARTPGIGPRTGFDDSCSTLLSGFTDFSDVITKAEARRTQINALIPGTIPAFNPEANHTLYLVTTGAASGLYTGYGVPIMDNLRLTAPLGGWTAASCTAAGYTLGGRLSNGNLYQTLQCRRRLCKQQTRR